jgi:hypothetical protein
MMLRRVAQDAAPVPAACRSLALARTVVALLRASLDSEAGFRNSCSRR